MYHYQDWLFLLDRSSLLDTHELHTLCHSTDNRSPMDMDCTRSHSLHPPMMSWCLGDTGLVHEILVDNSDLVDRHYSTYCCWSQLQSCLLLVELSRRSSITNHDHLVFPGSYHRHRSSLQCSIRWEQLDHQNHNTSQEYKVYSSIHSADQ